MSDSLLDDIREMMQHLDQWAPAFEPRPVYRWEAELMRQDGIDVDRMLKCGVICIIHDRIPVVEVYG